MNFFDLITTRRSVRAFQPTPVDKEKLRTVLEAAVAAPSAGNLQAYSIVVVHDPARRVRLAEAALGQDFLAQAPVVLVFCARPDISSARYRRRGAELYCVQDATIACTFAHLAAHALGLGSVWIGAFDEAAVRQTLGLPPHWCPVAMLPMGYPAESPAPTPRRPLQQTVIEM